MSFTSPMTDLRTANPDIDSLSVSVVVYRPDLALLAATLQSLAAACRCWQALKPDASVELCLVDNGGLTGADELLGALRQQGIACRVMTGHGNVGYGRGHNLALEGTQTRFHLVLNPDVVLDPDGLSEALRFFAQHPEAGLLSPRVVDEHGQLQYLCRRYPALFDLLVRGFLPARWRACFARRLARYEMREVINERDIVWDPAIVSGCFMLFRTNVLQALGGFDPRYFLYFEDYDLSLRAHDQARVAYVPAVRVLHHGGGAARKGLAHIRRFAASAFRFFNRFGWKWL
ncbi:glycosyltransferase family 2 protein [Paraburkholderia bonniea]|nr:glycosyltransferase family 2 protein [Paraburkholderia bonniea]WJF89581.1 glycosyltransferase family 2 protein [Paraburkholderia bonniea]WJF92895.1 glycosyltransferase family 2 protein [Paraburkholderia bonniea]